MKDSNLDEKDVYDKMWKKLYDKTFPQVKARYDAICKIFLEWNTGKIDSKIAYEKYKKLVIC